MIDCAFQNLHQLLLSISRNIQNKVERPVLDVPTALMLSWNIIDSSNRLRVLLRKLCNDAEPSDGEIGVFRIKAKSLRCLRDDLQHIEDRISKELLREKPVLGSLCWLYIPIPGEEDCFSFMALPGSAREDITSEHFVMPEGWCEAPVGNIKIYSIGKGIDISELYRSCDNLCKSLELILEPQFSGVEHLRTDLIVSLGLKASNTTQEAFTL